MIDWTAPNNGGSPITGYKVYIRSSDQTSFLLELNSCDGADPTIVANTLCSVPILTLRSAPFNLAWGSLIYAKVIAYNVYGNS